jgi:hypothetical protein
MKISATVAIIGYCNISGSNPFLNDIKETNMLKIDKSKLKVIVAETTINISKKLFNDIPQKTLPKITEKKLVIKLVNNVMKIIVSNNL